MDYKVELWRTSAIKPDPDQPRKTFSKEAIDELAESIRLHGMINNIEITPEGTIVTGENRWRAAKLVGLTHVPCRVIDPKGSDILARQLSENIHHIPMAPMDIAKAIKRYADEGKTVKEIGKIIGKHHTSVNSYLNLLKLPESVQKDHALRDIQVADELVYIQRAEKEGILPKGTFEIVQKKTIKEKIGRVSLRELRFHLLASPKDTKKFLKIDARMAPLEYISRLDGIHSTASRRIGKVIGVREDFLGRLKIGTTALTGFPYRVVGVGTKSKREAVAFAVMRLERQCQRWLEEAELGNWVKPGEVK